MRTRLSATLLGAAVLAVGLVGCTPDMPKAPATSTPAGKSAEPVFGTPLLPVSRHTESGPAGESWAVTDLYRYGFVDLSGNLVVEPRYSAFRYCPGADGTVVVVAQDGDRVDALGADGTVVGSVDARLDECGPLPGLVRLAATDGGWETWDTWAASLPDLSRTDLPVDGSFVVLDADSMLFQGWSDDPADLVSRSGERLATDAAAVGGAYYNAGPYTQVSTGQWPVPAVDDDWMYGYLDRSGRWVAPPRWTFARPFFGGYVPVVDGERAYFVDTQLAQVGPTYGSVDSVVAADPRQAAVLGYVVTTRSGRGSGLLAADLTVLADPETSTTTCHWSWVQPSAACLVVDDAGTSLITLPEGTRTSVDEQFTVVLSATTVANGKGTVVHNTATGTTFDIPAPFYTVTYWGPGEDAFVVCESDNGLRMVLDAKGKSTPFATVVDATMASDGTLYFWVEAGDQQGYVDPTGTWLYQESRYQLTKD